MIVATPLDLPKIEPDNWDVFWNIWEKYSDSLHKIKQNYDKSLSSVGANNVWRGLDIIKNLNISTAWEGPYYDIKNELPKMYNSIMSVDPGAFRVRLVQSLINVPPHTDDNRDKWNIRAFFYYPSKTPQWYFTKPNLPNEEKKYLTMPENTNWFTYNDKDCWHGTDFDPNNKKILLQIYSLYSQKELVDRSILKHKDFVIEF